MSRLLLHSLTATPDPTILNTASPEAKHIEYIGNGFLIAATGMFLLVVALTVYISIKYRSKADTSEPKQISGNRKVEVLMVAIPLLLVIFFFFWSMQTISAIMPSPANHPPDVIITGHQWWWQVNYPGTEVVTANEVHLPIGKKLLLQLNAADVIHDWWVPALGAKMDMIPGRTNYLWFTITKPGIYIGACSEFCGQQHAWMRIKVFAQSPADYREWLINQAQSPAEPKDTLAKAGAALFMKASCSSCHRIGGTVANGVQGPDLTHFASRTSILSGMMNNTAGNVNSWLTDPQKIKPGAHMPRFIFSKDSIRAITAYLTELK